PIKLRLGPKGPRSPTCQGCLLHPPPLVDFARDLTISGFFYAFSGRLASSPRRRSPAKRRRPHTLTTLRAACELRAIFLVACVSLLRPDSLHIHRIIDGCST